MEMTFPDWTSYDNWLIENYANYLIYSVNEVDGQIEIKYKNKEEDSDKK